VLNLLKLLYFYIFVLFCYYISITYYYNNKWKPKVPKSGHVKSPVKRDVQFDRTIRKPVGASKTQRKTGDVRLSNSFEPISRLGKEDGDEDERKCRTPIPITFLDVFENALSSRDKGKTKVGETLGERGFSPMHVL
jgi:hypothetical protein